MLEHHCHHCFLPHHWQHVAPLPRPHFFSIFRTGEFPISHGCPCAPSILHSSSSVSLLHSPSSVTVVCRRKRAPEHCTTHVVLSSPPSCFLVGTLSSSASPTYRRSFLSLSSSISICDRWASHAIFCVTDQIGPLLQVLFKILFKS